MAKSPRILATSTLSPTTTGDASTAFGISASVGTQSSKSESHSGQNTATGSTLTAGDNLSITATGGDITTIGSQIKAGLDVALKLVRGEPVETVTYVPFELVTPANAADYVGKN